jgi:glycosyltransferase involved in cell wall biosynthesis
LIDFVFYISPSWYFNKSVSFKIPYFVDYTLLEASEVEHCDLFSGYSNDTAVKIDVAFQLWKQGYITSDSSKILFWEQNELQLKDKYIFISRFYKKHWSLMVLFFRILELKNPLYEMLAFVQGIKTKRILSNFTFNYEIDNGLRNLQMENPLVSVIIPTLNRYKYLIDVMKDLDRQSYKNFEVIIFDQSEPFRQEFYENWNFNLKVIKQNEKALWLARNSAIKMSNGKLILLYDDDSLVDEDWILNHIKCLDYFNCEISSGVSISVVGGQVPMHYSYFRWSDQIDTGNVMLKRGVFEKIGLFDRQFERQRMGDGEFGLRAYLSGFKNISNPVSKRVHLKVSEGGLRQMGSWDAWRPKNIFAPRPIPSVLYLTRKYFGTKAAVFEIAVSVFTSVVPYRFKRNNNLALFGVFIGILFSPFLLISVIRSWRLATIKLEQGNRIEYL